MKKLDQEVWLKEFSVFSEPSASEGKIPDGLLSELKSRLFPNPWKVFAKISVIHFVVGFLSLGICNQFGLNPFNTNYSLSEYFMKVAGHNFCMIACGILFVATTYFLANIFLTLEEFESVKKYEWLQLGILSLASLAGFYYLGAELVGTFVGLWLFGALIGGVVSIEGSFRLRKLLSE